MRPVALLLAVLLGSCHVSEASTAPPVAIGFVGALTGPEGDRGLAELEALRLAAEAVNAGGGVNGSPLVVITRDAGAVESPGRAAALAEEFAAEGAVAVVPQGQRTAEAVADRIGALGVPVLATAPGGEAGEGPPGLFRLAPSDAYYARAIAQALEADGHRRVAVMARSQHQARALAEELELRFGEKRASVVWYDDTDVPEADAVLAEVPEDATAAVLFGGMADGAALVKRWSDSGRRPRLRWYFHARLKDPELARRAGAHRLEGHGGAAPRGGGADYDTFAAAYAERTGRVPEAATAVGYDAVMLAALAMVRGGTNTPEAVRMHLAEVSRGGDRQTGLGAAGYRDAVDRLRAGQDLDYQGASGTVDLGAHREVTSDYVVWRWQDGAPVDTDRVIRF